tara:strand:+ start:672 stop:1112 length:441 start_codon:yes stop_codon:yes gene_type:complete
MIEINVFIEPNLKNFNINEANLKALVLDVLKFHKNDSAKISIIFSKYQVLKELKIKFFNIDSNTDVIAFNLNEDIKNIDGEIYISPEIAKKNSRKFKNSFDDEIRRLIIHGTLHLIGYLDNNKTQKVKMNNIENEFLKKNLLELVC